MYYLIKLFWGNIGKQIEVYKLALKDSRTPFLVKLLLSLGIGYIVIPTDIIPDFIPFFGQLDDSIIFPILVLAAIFFIPDEVIRDSKAAVKNSKQETGRLLATNNKLNE